MQYRAFAVLIISLLLLQMYPVTIARDTGEINPGLNGQDITHLVTIKYWGFDSTSDIVDSVQPVTRLIQESQNHDSLESEQYNTLSYTRFDGTDIYYTIVHHITYRIRFVETNDFDDLVETFANQSQRTDGQYVRDDKTLPISGLTLSTNTVSQFLGNYNENEGLTLHVLNFTSVDAIDSQYPNHWFYTYSGINNYNESSDFRTTGTIGDRGIFYDPTGFTPFFSGMDPGFERLKDNTPSGQKILLNNGINNLIENVIIGTPYSTSNSIFNLEDLVLEVGQVVITSSDAGQEVESLSRTLNPDFRSQVFSLWSAINGITSSNLFEYDKINVRTFERSIEDIPFLNDTIDANVELVNGKKILTIDSQMAEFFKNVVRNYIYFNYPSGFFYLNLVFAFDKNLTVMYQSESGLVPYTNQIIGLSILDLGSWMSLPIDEKAKISIRNLDLKLIGMNFGLPILESGPSVMIDTPMSTMASGINQDINFNGYDKLNLITRYSAIANSSVRGRTDNYDSVLNSGIYRAVPPGDLYDADVVRTNATQFFHKGDYVTAFNLYLKAMDIMDEAEKQIIQRINLVRYTPVWAVMLFFLYALFTYIRSYTYKTKEKYEYDQDGIPKDWIYVKSEK